MWRAAIRIQACWRGYRTRVDLHRHFAADRAATVIQSAWYVDCCFDCCCCCCYCCGGGGSGVGVGVVLELMSVLMLEWCWLREAVVDDVYVLVI